MQFVYLADLQLLNAPSAPTHHLQHASCWPLFSWFDLFNQSTFSSFKEKTVSLNFYCSVIDKTLPVFYCSTKMFVLCLSWDLWSFSTSFMWSLILFLRALNFLVSEFMTLTSKSMFSSKRSSSHSFYCHFFSTGSLCFLCWGIFFLLSRTSVALPGYILTGDMILANGGGLVILPHVCNDLRSVQGGHSRELLAEGSSPAQWKTG